MKMGRMKKNQDFPIDNFGIQGQPLQERLQSMRKTKTSMICVQSCIGISVAQQTPEDKAEDGFRCSNKAAPENGKFPRLFKVYGR